MKSWEAYKKHVQSTLGDKEQLNEEIDEEVKFLILSVIQKRQEMGISQRKLGELCHLPHSSITRIESFHSIPRMDTLLKMMKVLDLHLQITFNIKKS